MTNVEQHIRGIADRVAADLGLEVVDVELRGTAGKSRMLRVFLDKAVRDSQFALRQDEAPDANSEGRAANSESGVTHEDCVAFSHEFGTILDAEDAVPGSGYTLEVSSPGLDRKLVKAADYQRFQGQLVRLTTREPIEGRRNFQGRLQGLQDGRVALALEHGKEKKAKANKGRSEEAEPQAAASVAIDFGNIEKANLVPEW